MAKKFFRIYWRHSSDQSRELFCEYLYIAMNQKKIVIGILFVVVFAIAGVFVWKKNDIKPNNTNSNQQTNFQVQDWKIYQNDNYGFEIKYPADWAIIENAGDNTDRSVISLVSPETQKIILDKKTSSSCDFSVYYYNSILDEPENKANEFKAITIEEMINKNHMITRIGQIDLGGEPAIDVVWGGAGANYTILSDYKNHLYKISSCAKEKRSALTQTEVAILGSFNFIK
mgnify:FL=1